MKLLSLFLIVTVVAARSPTRPVSPQILIRPSPLSWFIDNNVKDAAGCNSSWSTASTVHLQTPAHRLDRHSSRILIDTRGGGSTGDSRNVCVYKPPQTINRKWRECKHKGKRVKCPPGERFEKEEVPGEWIFGKGTVGKCGQGGCCEWNTTTNNIRRPSLIHHTWYETTTDCEGERPDLITGPLLMRGLEGQRKSICEEVAICKKGEEGCDSGKLTQVNGNLRFCANQCCILALETWRPKKEGEDCGETSRVHYGPCEPGLKCVYPDPNAGDIMEMGYDGPGYCHRERPEIKKGPKKNESMDELPYISCRNDQLHKCIKNIKQ